MSESCREAEALLSSYLDGEIPAADALRVKAHLETCEGCRAVLEGFVTNDAALQESTVQRTEEEWNALAARVEETLDREATDRDRSGKAETTGTSRWFRWRPRPVLLGSAGTLALALLVALLQPWAGMQNKAPETVSTGRLESGMPTDNLAEEKEEAPASSAARERLAARSLEADLDTGSNEPARKVTGGDADGALGQGSRATSAQDSEDRKRTDTAPPTDALAEIDIPAKTDALVRAVEPTPTRARTEPPVLSAAPETLADEATLSEGEEVAFGLVKDFEAGLPVESELSRRGLGPQPPQGATSLSEAREWWASQSEPRASAQGRVLPAQLDVAQRTPNDSFLDDALAGARRLRSSGDRQGTVDALRILSGDFPENTVREEAWFDLLQVQGDAALYSADAEATTDVARSFDAFRVRYPSRDEILELRARVWVHVARLEVDGSCAGARQRVYEWRDAESSERRQGEATVLRGTLDRICGDAPTEDDR